MFLISELERSNLTGCFIFISDSAQDHVNEEHLMSATFYKPTSLYYSIQKWQLKKDKNNFNRPSEVKIEFNV